MTCPLYDSDGIEYKTKVPGAVLDYKLDLAPLTNGRDGAETNWLESGNTVTAHTVTADTGITVDSSSIADSGTSIIVWFSGGTLGNDYDFSIEFSTSGGQTDVKTRRIKMVAEK